LYQIVPATSSASAFDSPGFARIAQEGDRQTREIERVAVQAGDHFHGTRVGGVGWITEASHQRAHDGIVFGKQRLDGLIDRGWFQERFVALDINHQRPRKLFRCLGHPIGPGTMRRASHNRLRTKALGCQKDVGMIGRDDHLVDQSSRPGAFPNAFQHGLCTDLQQGLVRETGGL